MRLKHLDFSLGNGIINVSICNLGANLQLPMLYQYMHEGGICYGSHNEDGWS